MQHIHNIDQLSLKRCSLTIGSFDGVHKGHQALIERFVSHAHSRDEDAVVLTFFPHPSVVLRERKPAYYINTPEEKAELMEELGVDIVITQLFDLELSKVSADEIIDLLQDRCGFTNLWVGEDFALGHNRRGNRYYLEREGMKRGFEVHVIEPVLVSGEIVSSTRVREALRSGDVARVERYLGRPFTVPGKVVSGAGRGRELGFPTANLEIWEERAFPRTGVYACMAEVDGKQWKAVTNIGVRPTFDSGEASSTVEAHLLDYSGDLYAQEIRLTFVARIRDERRFDGPEALMERIHIDIERANQILDDR